MTATVPAARHGYYAVDSPYEVARWRPLVHWLLFIPHGVIAYSLRSLACVVAVVYWLVLLFTGKLNRGLYGMMTFMHEGRQYIVVQSGSAKRGQPGALVALRLP